MKYLLIFAISLPAISTLAQTKGRAVAAELQLFKDEGAMIVSSDTELVRLAKTYIDFGELYTPEEMNPEGFKGLYISEYTAMGMAQTDNRSGYDVITFGSDYYLLASTEPAIPGERGRTLRHSQACVGVPINNTLRERLPLLMIAFNNLLHLSYATNEDISVAPPQLSMERAIGTKILALRGMELLIMNHELNKSLTAKPEKIGNVYPYPYAVSDLYEALRAVHNRTPGKAVVFAHASQTYWAVYVIRCDTHELLYGWARRMYGRELNVSDFSNITTAIQNAG